MEEGIEIVIFDELFLNSFSADIPVLVVNGILILSKTVPGDLSGDGEINAVDAVTLAQVIAGWDVDCDALAADCNGDGEVNAIDAVLLAQKIAGWDVILG